jgi:hypothetical protein
MDMRTEVHIKNSVAMKTWFTNMALGLVCLSELFFL